MLKIFQLSKDNPKKLYYDSQALSNKAMKIHKIKILAT